MKPEQTIKNTGLALAAVLSTVGCILSFRQPAMPVFAFVGAAAGRQLLSSHPGSKSRRQQETEARQQEIEAKEREVAALAVQAKAKAEQEAIAQIEQYAEAKRQELLEQQALIEQAKQQLNSHNEVLAAKQASINHSWQQLQEEAQKVSLHSEKQRQTYQALAAKSLAESYKNKQPDLPEGVTYEDMVAREIIWLLYNAGIIVKKPFVRPFEKGFDLHFTILPATPDLDASGQEKKYVQSLGEALHCIERNLLVDIQSRIYACDRVPVVSPVYDGLKLTCYVNHFQGAYSGTVEDADKPVYAIVSEHGLAGAIANEIIAHCHKQGVRLDFMDACQYSPTEAICWFKPEFKNKLYKISDILKGFESEINHKVHLRPELEGENGEYLSVLWTTSVEEFIKVKDKDGKEILIEEPDDPNWFRNVVLDPKSSHHLIHGPTGTGKSVGVDNICCVAGDDLADRTGKQVHINICDPKYPDSEWTYRGKRIRPQYRGWEGALEGVLAMNEEVSTRLEIAAEAADSVPDELFADPDYTLPLPERDIDIWVVDEAAALHERYEKQVGPAFRETGWVARSALVKMILIGQNPNCSNYGLQIPDLSNFVRWYLGITGLEALDKVIKPPRDIKARLKAQIYARLRLVKQLKMQGVKNPKEQYFVLVWMNNEEPFVAQMPAPKAYANSDRVAASVTPQPDSLLDLVEQSLTESEALPQVHQLDELFQQSDESYKEQRLQSLPQHLRDIVALAQSTNDWIAARDFQRSADRYLKVKPDLIRDWFKEIADMELGFVGTPKRTLCYRWNPIADKSDSHDKTNEA